MQGYFNTLVNILSLGIIYFNAVLVVGRACSTYVWEERYIQCFSGNLRERAHLKDPDVDGRIILKWVLEKWGGVHGLD
jgi:hypothetical protein